MSEAFLSYVKFSSYDKDIMSNLGDSINLKMKQTPFFVQNQES